MMTKIMVEMWKDEDGRLYDTQELLEMGYHFVNGEPMMPPFEMLAEYEYEMRHAPRYVNNGEGAK